MKGPVFARARARRQAELAVCRVEEQARVRKGGHWGSRREGAGAAGAEACTCIGQGVVVGAVAQQQHSHTLQSAPARYHCIQRPFVLLLQSIAGPYSCGAGVDGACRRLQAHGGKEACGCWQGCTGT